LDQVLWQRDEEVAQQKDREREPEGRVREPDSVELVVQVAKVPEELDQRDERGLDRDDHQRDHEEEDRVPERERDPREGERRERAERKREDGRGERDVEGVEERVPHAGGVQDAAVVVQGQIWVEKGVPPADRADLRARPEGGDREAKGRD